MANCKWPLHVCVKFSLLSLVHKDYLNVPVKPGGKSVHGRHGKCKW